MKQVVQHGPRSTAASATETCPLHFGRVQTAYDLPCGHTACEECLHAIATASTQRRKSNIQCPVCQVVSAFDPQRRDQEEAEILATSRPSSRSSSFSSGIVSPVVPGTPKTRRYQIKLQDSPDNSTSALTWVPEQAVVNKRVILKLTLGGKDGKVIIPERNTYVRGTILLPDQTLTEIDFLPSGNSNFFTTENPSHSFEKVIVPNQIGKYEVEVNLGGAKHVMADMAVQPSGGKTFDTRSFRKLKNPHDIIVSGGQYVITDKGNHRVVVLDHEANFHMEFGRTPPKGLKKIGPFGIAADPIAFYVTDNNNKCVLRFVRQTAKLSVWAKVGPCPTGIALDQEFVYVADAKECSIRAYSRHAEHRYTISYKGALDGGLNFPWLMAVNSKGHLVVADRDNCRIQIFDPRSRKSLNTIALTTGNKKWHCRGIAVDKFDNIYATARRLDSWRGCSRETIMAFSSDGTYLGNFGDLREFDYIRGIAIDEEMSTAVVVDGANHQIKGYRL
ncbi:uncharacterized protein [Diadema antillarum]|uniref:uncharacterized protein n=1 Tax=Diadema antillarum TaxID=105358 RepID=UPI003A874528